MDHWQNATPTARVSDEGREVLVRCMAEAERHTFRRPKGSDEGCETHPHAQVTTNLDAGRYS